MVERDFVMGSDGKAMGVSREAMDVRLESDGKAVGVT